jgi:hypothetical protein
MRRDVMDQIYAQMIYSGGAFGGSANNDISPN